MNNSAAPAASCPAPSSAAVDPKIAEFCMKATDFSGCVQTMTGGLAQADKGC